MNRFLSTGFLRIMPALFLFGGISVAGPKAIAPAALRPGKNIMAAHCHQTVGGQYFDVGIEGVGSGATTTNAAAGESTYRGWKMLALRNGLIGAQFMAIAR